MRVWAIANQKGGVGKTTTTLALGRGLAMRGHRVLLVDLDPHASLTRAFGVATDPQPAGVLDLFDEQPPALATLARATEIENLSFIAAAPPSRASGWRCRTHWRAAAMPGTSCCSTVPPRWAC